jgi:hypothetical protein
VLWRRVGLVRTDVSDQRVASNFKVERISELRTESTESNPNSLFISNLKMKATRFSETFVLTRPTRCHIQ